MEQALESFCPEAVPHEARDVVQGYNRTTASRRCGCATGWRSCARGSWPPARRCRGPSSEAGEASEKVDERAQRVEALRARLLAGIPEERRERSDEQQARWLLAYLLDWHRREDKAVWWEYFRLKELPEEELFDEAQALAGLEFVERVGVVADVQDRKADGLRVDRYRFPAQEMEIRRKARAEAEGRREVGRGGRRGPHALTIDVKKGPKQADHHATSAFAFKYVDTGDLEEAIGRFARGRRRPRAWSSRDGPPANAAAHRLLLARDARAAVGRLRCCGWRVGGRVRRPDRQRPRRDGPADPGPARVGEDVLRRAR